MISMQSHRHLSRAGVVGMWLASSFIVVPYAEAFVQPCPFSSPRPTHSTSEAKHSHLVLSNTRNSVMEEGGMILSNDNNLLNAAFSSLNDKDKYETVLTGLCAKVVDGGSSSAKEGLVDPIRLLEEMNSSRIMAGPRGIISLVDVSFGFTIEKLGKSIFLTCLLFIYSLGGCFSFRCAYYVKSFISCNKKRCNIKLWYTSKYHSANTTNLQLFTIWCE